MLLRRRWRGVTAARRLTVFVAASVRMYEEGLAAVIRDDPRFELVGTALSRHALYEAVAGLDAPPNVVLVDLGRAEGVAAVRALRRTRPESGDTTVRSSSMYFRPI
jgi:DNA-binding NarL/FixJ family response regulator